MLHLGPLNSVKKSAKSKNTVGGMMVYSSFCGFFLYIKPAKNLKFPPAIVFDCTQFLPQLWRFWQGPSRYLPTPGRLFFIISILKQSSHYRRRQRVGTSRYRYDLYYVPPAIVFFAAERPSFNLGAYWVVKPLKYVFYDFKGRGPLKNSKKFAGMLTN